MSTLHPSIHPSIHNEKRKRGIQNSGLFALFLFFSFFSFFPFNMQCEEKALEIQSRKIPFVFSPPRRRFRKVLEGSSIYSFVASKMPHPRREGGGLSQISQTQQQLFIVSSKQDFSFVEKALNDCKMADHLVLLFLSQVFS